MSVVALGHAEPWGQAGYLALPRAGKPIDLLDGALLVTPAPASDHQHHQQYARRLANPAPSPTRSSSIRR